MKENKTISQMFMGIINHLNQRPILTLAIVVTLILDFVWLSYANFFKSGVLTYFEYRPFQAGSIVLVAIITIVVLLKKLDK
ncbi:hypothetical protein [Colwellia piezophila]|uniref:hypothetical protein n=1 Tax=Colwellia piezophila TaxID=211668 RepID=UPI000362834E|nr:hypothetical protein [Colwellia piezophila]